MAITAFVALVILVLKQRVDRTRRLDRRPRRLAVIHRKPAILGTMFSDGSRDGDVPFLAARPGHQALTSSIAGGQLPPGSETKTAGLAPRRRDLRQEIGSPAGQLQPLVAKAVSNRRPFQNPLQSTIAIRAYWRGTDRGTCACAPCPRIPRSTSNRRLSGKRRPKGPSWSPQLFPFDGL